MSFVRRRIDLTFTLSKTADGTYPTFNGDATTVKVSGLRVKASISNSGAPSMGVANVRVYGLTLQMMSQLAQVMPRTSKGAVDVRFNSLQIDAGDADPLTTIFKGQIIQAPIDMNNVPSSCLVVIAQAGAYEAVIPAVPLSYTGTADAIQMLKTLATNANLLFENGTNLSVQLSRQYLSGSPREQMQKVAAAANINFTIDNGVAVVWPKGGVRPGTIPVISSDTSMIGYPANFGVGIEVKTVFMPQVKIGQAFEVKSTLPFANGKWTAYDISHDIESETPNGDWFSKFHGSPMNAPA